MFHHAIIASNREAECLIISIFYLYIFLLIILSDVSGNGLAGGALDQKEIETIK